MAQTLLPVNQPDTYAIPLPPQAKLYRKLPSALYIQNQLKKAIFIDDKIFL